MEDTIIFVVEPRIDTIIEENEDESEQIDTSIQEGLCVCDYLDEAAKREENTPLLNSDNEDESELINRFEAISEDKIEQKDDEIEQIDDSNKKGPCVCAYLDEVLTEEDITRFLNLNIKDDI
jgi:hypothetical protein